MIELLFKIAMGLFGALFIWFITVLVKDYVTSEWTQEDEIKNNAGYDVK